MGMTVACSLPFVLLALQFTPPGCPTRKITFKIKQEDIARQERAEAEGHQPWRTNAKMVADVALLEVENGMDPKMVDSVPFKQVSKSETQVVYQFELANRHRSDRVTVKRFRRVDPEMGRTGTTAWWANGG